MRTALLGAIAGAFVIAAGSAFGQDKPDPVVGGATLAVEVNVLKATASGYRASKLIRSDIYNDGGEKIGKVDDFIVGSDQFVSIAVVSVGGFLGVGDKLVAIPASMFKSDKDGRVMLPGGTKDKLKGLPKFEYVKK